ncbi:MAG: response regulator [Saprospiraceae bacterium]|nr:response regulator transcription factor [Lewinella sp.]
MKKILIIERHDPLRESIAEFLALYNFRVFEAQTGYQGLQLAREEAPDLIICARNFFDCSCWQILEELRKEGSTRETPFIFLSSKPAGEQHEKLSGQKAVSILIKPFSMDDLLKTIRECLAPKPAITKLEVWNSDKSSLSYSYIG